MAVEMAWPGFVSGVEGTEEWAVSGAITGKSLRRFREVPPDVVCAAGCAGSSNASASAALDEGSVALVEPGKSGDDGLRSVNSEHSAGVRASGTGCAAPVFLCFAAGVFAGASASTRPARFWRRARSLCLIRSTGVQRLNTSFNASKRCVSASRKDGELATRLATSAWLCASMADISCVVKFKVLLRQDSDALASAQTVVQWR